MQTELLIEADKSGRIHVVSPGTGVRAFVPGDVIGWAVFGLVFGGIAGLAGGGGVLGFAESARRSPGSCGASSGWSPARSTPCGRAARSRRGG